LSTPTKRTTTKKPKPPVVDGFLAELAAGCYDADLVRLANAVGARVQEAGLAVRWKLTFAGTTWTQETVSTGERVYAEQYLTLTTGRPFSYLELDPARFITHAAALVVAHLHVVDNLTPSKAIDLVGAITEADWRDVIDVYQAA
jgi:hypothetical protein